MKRLQEKELGQRLREEGRQTSPPFSLVLHERVIHALRARGLKEDAAEPRERRWIWRMGIPLAIAAAAAVATWLILPRTQTPLPRSAPIVDGSPVAPSNSSILLAPASTDELNRAKYAYLDRDAQRLFFFVANQLPEIPEPPEDP